MKTCRLGHIHSKKECPVCSSIRAKKWYSSPVNKDLKKSYALKWRERKKCYDINRLYNISFDTYIAILKRQNSQCAICKKSTKLHVDHCHTTGKVRGLLCVSCNNGLGRFKDNTEYLHAALVYLKSS